MKRLYVVIVIMVFLFLGAVSWGVVTQINVINKDSELKIISNQLYLTQNNLVATESELQTAQDELSDFKAKYPPHEFTDISELQGWVNSHKKPTIQWYDNDRMIANEVVIEGLTDGYLMYTEIWYFTDVSYNGVAIINTYIDGELYWWRPDETEIKQW